jgi:tRNA pseudouridine55 synthase
MENGILLIDKEAGFTSRDVDNALEKKFQTKRVGHLGTLDPFATGLLVVGINAGTKFLPFLDDAKKSYIATLKLGETTSSLDPESPVSETKEVPLLNEEEIAEVFRSFRGKGEQMPPMTSAIKINGEPLYKAAHQGQTIERKPRAIEIYSLNLISYKDKVITFSCTVSRGTYIRVLGQDIATKLGTVGYLTSLRRLGLGPFLVSQAKKLADIASSDFLDSTLAITTMKHVEIDTDEEKRVLNGAFLELDEDYGPNVLLTLHGEALAVYELIGGHTYKPTRILV